MDIVETKAWHLFYEDVLRGEQVNAYRKYLGDIPSIFAKADGVGSQTLLYTVYSYDAGDSQKLGELNWGLTVLEPVLINGECNMTRGHFHRNRDCAEFYFGIGGKGLLLLMDGTGRTWAEKVSKGSLHHIDGSQAHRLINTGEEPLSVGSCWPAAAGHDYEAIEKSPFQARVFRREGQLIIVEAD